MTVNFKAYHFEQAETATKLYNSSGEAKGRLHFFDYVGTRGEDRYGVAAEEVDASTELGCFEKWRYFLHTNLDDTGAMKTYKINKASFQKRFDVSDVNLEFLLDPSGVTLGQFPTITNEKATKVQAWESKQQGPKSAFTRNFIESLIKAEINPDFYQALIFSKADQVDTNWPKNALVISYKDESSVLFRTTEPLSTILDVDLDRFEELQEGKPLSKKEIFRIINPRRKLSDWLNKKMETRNPCIGKLWTFDKKETRPKEFNNANPSYLTEALLQNSLLIIKNNNAKTFDFISIHSSGFIEIKENVTPGDYLPSRINNQIVLAELTQWVNTQ